MIAQVRCAQHRALAGWRCRSCGHDLCPACVLTRVAGYTEWVACRRCGELADRLMRPRSAAKPFPLWLGEALRFPFTKGALVAVAAAALVFAALGIFGPLGAFLRLCLVWALFFAVIRQGAAGASELQPPDFGDIFADVFAPALRGLAGTGLVWGPPAYASFRWIMDGDGDVIMRSPVTWAVMAAGLVLAPAALLLAGAGAGLFAMLNPRAQLKAIVKLGSDYAFAWGVLAALALAQLLLKLLAGDLGGIPLISSVLGEVLGLVAPVAGARVLGILLHVRGDALGLGHEDDHLVPVLPGAVPLAVPDAAAGAGEGEAPSGT